MSSVSRPALIGAGANLGDRAATLARAMDRLRATPGIAALETSSLYETAPVGPVAQPPFLNLVAGFDTSLTPEALLELLLAIERAFGRVRRERWGPRTLDLDFLALADETRDTPQLQLPHPRLAERGFVLIPLAELLARPRFQIPAWAGLRARAAAWPAEPGVRRVS